MEEASSNHPCTNENDKGFIMSTQAYLVLIAAVIVYATPTPYMLVCWKNAQNQRLISPTNIIRNYEHFTSKNVQNKNI